MKKIRPLKLGLITTGHPEKDLPRDDDSIWSSVPVCVEHKKIKRKKFAYVCEGDNSPR